MKLRPFAASVALMMTCASSALAFDAVAIGEAFQSGRASGQVPTQPEELLQCSTHWFTWLQMGDVELSGVDIGAFGAGLSGDAAVETLDHWDQAAYHAFVASRGEAAYADAAQASSVEAMQARAAFAQGNYGIMRILGRCSR